MQNWESMPQAYEHNWFGGVPAIKREVTSQPYNLGQHLLQKSNSMDTYSSQSSPPRTDGLEMHSFYENHIYNGLNNSHHPLGFNPLTPPGYPNAIIPQINFGHNNLQDTVSSPSANAGYKQIDITQSLTPSHTPPMDDTPPKSPKLLLDTPEKDNELSSNSNESGEDTRFVESDNDDDSINKPKFNSHGKVKKYKCKQCEYVAITKVDFWTHGRDHIKPEKLLECHLCPFATELKHHLEYHIRKHKNLKPFRCNKCSYSCVNKSMLNSHLKSHSTVYQYRCANCDYATKYCHSFKLHLRKYTHKPGMVLNEDGTPNPTVIIDIYGTRRGPKMKSSNGREGSNSKSTATKQEPRNSAQPVQSSATPHSRVSPVTSNQQPSSNMMANLLPNTLASMLQQSGNLNFLPYLNLQMLAVHQQAVLAQLSPNMVADQQSLGKNDDKGNQYDSDSEEFDREPIHHSAMDLSQATPTKTTNCSSLHRKEHGGLEPSPTATPVISTAKIHRRKGRAFKLDAISNSEDDAPSPPPAKSVLSSFDGTRTVKTPESPPTPSNNEAEEAKERRRAVMPTDGDTPEANAKKIAECKYCGIYFRDLAFYSIHMGYHSCDDAFKCNMCGEQCGDPLTFFVHIGRTAHS